MSAKQFFFGVERKHFAESRMKVTEILKTLLISTFGIIPIALLFYGYRGYQVVLSKNDCKMTYSYPFHYETKFEWKNENFKLLQVSSEAGEAIHGHPVLFIPGHKGSHKQIRSFASEMHNEDRFFQYFAVDFNQDIVGLHGKDLLLKAAFVNEALRTIKKLYSKPDLTITLLAHSYGGMIAKTTVLLSNHPNCIVDSIFMLGTPNTKPVHGIDASLTSVFNQVNKAYYSAFYSNNTCGYYNIAGKYATTRVQFLPACTACVKNISVIVVSGGDADLEVAPTSTNIFDIAAHPRNLTSLPIKQKGSFVFTRILSFISDARIFLFRTGYRTIFGESKSTTIPANSTDVLEQTENSTLIAEEEIENEEFLVPENSTYHFITRKLWDETIIPYYEPRHISYRTSQFVHVGFPMDHYALLWCRDLLSEVSSAMRKLTKKKDIPLSKLFEIRDHQILTASVQEVQPLKIKELFHYVGRNTSNQLWLKAGQYDQHDMFEKIGQNSLQLFAINYFLRQWQDGIFYTFALIIFSLSMKILAILTAFENRIHSNSFIADIELVVLFIRQFYKMIKENQLFYVLFGVFSVVIYYARRLFFPSTATTGFGLTSIDYEAASLNLGYIVLGLAFGLSFRSIIFAVIRNFRSILNFLFGRNRKITCEGEGEGSGRGKNIIRRLLGKFFWKYLNEFLLIASWLTVFVVFQASSDIPFTWMSILCSLSVVVYAALVVEFIYVNVTTTKNHFYTRKSGTNGSPPIEYIDEEIVFLVFWILVTALPSLKFCAEVTFVKSSLKFETFLYDLFMPDHIQYLLILIITYALLRILSSKKRILNIQPMASLLTLLDKPIKKTGCMHEDGGVNAIFEEVPNENDMKVDGQTICLGTTYRVIWCNCKENRNFKTLDEWCEWCTCPKCNPAGSYGYQSPPKGNRITINLDLVLGLILLSISIYVIVFVRDELYTSLYSAAYVSTAIVFRSFYSKRTLEITL